jgi:L-malate glycosyltransferase
MKILFTNYEYPPLGGGGGVINAQLATELAKRHEVTVLTSRALGTPEEELANGVRIVRVNVWGRAQAAAANTVSMASYLPMGILGGRSLFRSQDFDVINTHFVVPTGPVGAHLARKFAVPNVLTVHGGDLYDPSKASSPHRHLLLRMLIRRLLNRADAVVGQSRNTVTNVHQYYDENVDVDLIPLGISRPARPVADRKILGFDDEEKLLVTVGRLVARKGLHQLVNMMARFGDRKVRLVVIGDGPLMGELKEQAKDKGVDDKVTFAGFVSDQEKVDLLAVSDLYVSSSQHEGFGLVFLEGMAAGLPVICYDFGGQTDFLDDNVTGALIPLNDEDCFFAACSRHLDSPEQRTKAGDENRRRVEAYYIENCALRYESLFDEVVRHYHDES